jgi:phosphoglycolate phosphatase-like HAD superfamily hydrolase
MGSSQLLADLLCEDADRIGLHAEQRHSEHYQRAAPLLRVFEGARELVTAVAQRGARVVLASSAAPDELERLRSVLDIEDAVAEITGGGDVEAAKPGS